MRFSLFAVTLALLLICGLVRCQDDEEFDLENDVEVEDEPEEDVPKEKVIVQYTPPHAKGPTHFHEAFLEESALGERWVQSSAKKDGVEADLAKYDGKWAIEEPTDQPLQGDLGLVLKSKAKHHAVSALLDKPFDFEAEPFIVQYEVKFQNGMECGGAYIKLLSQTLDLQLKNVQDKTPYTIMFGPDKCGNDQKLHFIFRHKHPITGVFEEKHSKKPSGNFNRIFSDKKTHLFTLVVHPDNNFEIFIDQASVSSGNLLEDMTPPINPPEEIDDPNDEKPEEWDDKKKIPDPDSTKPDDWDEDAPATIVDEDAVMPDGWLEDEPELIDDPNAEKPEDWDEEMDGEWEAPKIKNSACIDVGCGNWEKPTIPNPEYKGKWKRPMVDNANYKGEWKPQRISNPDYFEDMEPFHMTTIGAVGLELWSMTDGILFDNFIITSSRDVADEWAADTWALKLKQEGVSGSAESVVSGLMTAASDRPWLWAIYALVLIIPLFVCFKLCFRKSPPVADDAKKSDAATPDDETKKDKEEEGAEEGEEEGAEPGAEEGAEPGAEKGAEPGDEEGEDESTVRQRKKATKADLEQSADADEAKADSNEGAGDTVRKSPRKGKGKTRKE